MGVGKAKPFRDPERRPDERRNERSVSDVYEDTLTPAEQLRWCKKELYPIRDRILSITNGNHEDRIKRETSIDVVGELAEYLGIRDRHFPNGVLLKLCFGRKRNQNELSIRSTTLTVEAAGRCRAARCSAWREWQASC